MKFKRGILAPIFKRSDFVLCDVPVPAGYPQSQTHCEFVFHKGRYFMSTSPYPVEMRMVRRGYRKLLRLLTFNKYGKFVDGAQYENPCVYVAADSQSSAPTQFSPFVVNPLFGALESGDGLVSCNSDPQLFSDEGHLWLFNRVYKKYSSGEIGADIMRVEIIDKNGRHCISEPSIFRRFDNVCVSPTIIHYGASYYFMYLDTNSYNDGRFFNGLYYYKSDSLDGLNYASELCKVEVIKNPSLLPWHFSLFQYEGRMYAVVACVEYGRKYRCIQMLGVFDSDVSHLTISPKPLTSLNSYRGCAHIMPDGTFLLYTTTVAERFHNDYSVDGRNVLLAKMNFKDVVKCTRLLDT